MILSNIILFYMLYLIFCMKKICASYMHDLASHHFYIDGYILTQTYM